MKKLLIINSCVRANSRTMYLCKYLLKKIHNTKDFILDIVDLDSEQIPSMDKKTLKMRDLCGETKDFSDNYFRYAKQFREADTIVIAAPYWDLSFPSSLKCYIEAITICNLTFRYTKDGKPEGLCKADRLIYVSTAGGPIIGENLGYRYIEAVAKTFYGIKTTELIQAENLDVYGSDINSILTDAKTQIDELQF